MNIAEITNRKRGIELDIMEFDDPEDDEAFCVDPDLSDYYSAEYEAMAMNPILNLVFGGPF